MWDSESGIGAEDVYADMKKLADEKIAASNAKLRNFDEAFLEYAESCRGGHY